MGDDPVFLMLSWYVYQLLCCNKCKFIMRDRVVLQIMVIIMHRFLLMKDIIILYVHCTALTDLLLYFTCYVVLYLVFLRMVNAM